MTRTYFFSPQSNADCCGREQWKLGICSRGLSIYTALTKDRGCQWCLPVAWDLSWPQDRRKGALGPASLAQRAVPPAPLGSLPWPHSATASALFPSWEMQQETRRGLGVKCGIISSLPTQIQNTFLQGCTHDRAVPPIDMRAGTAWTISHPLVFVFPGTVLQTVT